MLKLEHMNFGWLHAPPLPPACCHCLLIQKGDQVALIDAGIGLQDIAEPEKRIGAEAIKAAGFKFLSEATAARQLEERRIPASAVTDIILTHGDPDHAGGLSDFPEATVHLSAEELSNIQSNRPRYGQAQFSHQPRWKTYRDNDSSFLGLPSRIVTTRLEVDIHLVPLPGHTVGHCGVAVHVHGRWVFHVGDAYYLRAELSDRHHPIDQLATMAAEDDHSRRQSLDNLRSLAASGPDGCEMIGYHDTSELPAAIPVLSALSE